MNKRDQQELMREIRASVELACEVIKEQEGFTIPLAIRSKIKTELMTSVSIWFENKKEN